MTTISEFCFPAAETVLGEAFERLPSVSCELEQVAIADKPGIWFQGADRHEIEDALEADSTATDFNWVTNRDDEHLYKLEFVEEFDERIAIIMNEGGTVLSASASNGSWFIRLRFPDRNAVRRVYERFDNRGITINITVIRRLNEETMGSIGLTPEQHETLVAAIEHGYFDIPRQISMEELATELDISHQAMSERLRRAYKTLVAAELDETTGEDDS